MSVIQLHADNFEQEVLKSDRTVLIDFYADWCNPCRMLSPTVEKIADEREDIKVCKVNVDSEGALAAKFAVDAIPMLAVVRDGKTVKTSVGYIPEQAVLELQKAELAAKKKPKAEVFDIDAASETARRLKETGSTFDGSAAKTGEDVIAAVERETAELAAMQAAGAAPEAAETVQDEAAKPQLLDFLAGEPEAENDPFADQPTQTAPELPELTPAQELAGYIRSRSAAALVTPHALLVSEVENADELLAQMPQDPQCEDIVVRAGAKDTYYYSNANMSDNYAMIAQLIEDKDLCVMFAEMVRFNARVYPSATPLKYFQRSPYGLAPEEIEQTWKTMQGRPEFADIEELTNNQNERFLFSTQHLTRRYAKAISDVDDFCD